MNRGRYRRRLKREARKAAKAAEANAGGDDHGKMPGWFKYVAWGACIAWCVPLQHLALNMLCQLIYL